jgi:GxxExxY protein
LCAEQCGILRRKTQKLMSKLLFEKESYLIIGACFELYKEIGNGHKESVYQKGLVIILAERKLAVEKEKKIPIKIRGEYVGNYVPDLVVDDRILLELKAKPFLTTQDRKQFWHYIKATDYKLGFLINFGKPGGVEIVRRVYDKARNKIRHVSA